MNRRFPNIRPSIIVGALLVTAVTFAIAGPAAAQTGGCSGLNRGGTECSISDVLNPQQPAPGGPAVLRSSSPPGPTFDLFNTTRVCDAAGSAGWTSLSDVGSAIFDLGFLPGAVAPAEPGVLWIFELRDPAGGAGLNSGYISCVGAGSGLPPLPPPLPTAGDIWGAALTDPPEVHLDPYVRGLTGLETYMWHEGQTTDSVTITLNGYTVTAQIDAVRFIWDTGGESRTGQQRYSRAVPGSADDPAAIHTYALPADVVIVHEIVWTGTAVITGPGAPAGGVVVDLGQAVLSTARAYDVIEVRTPLVRSD